MGLFGNIFKKGSDSKDEAIPREIFDSIRVMQDDLNELHGKPKVAQSQVVDDGAVSNHPFLGAKQKALDASLVLPQKSEMPTTGKKDASKEKRMSLPKESGGNHVIPIISVVILLAIIGGAGFVFYQNTRFNAEIPESPEGAPQENVGIPEETIDPVEEPMFSSEKPNLVQIDPETDGSTPENMLVKFDALQESVRLEAPTAPIEFLVRDMNNNPIAFSRIAYLLGLDISETMLASLDESFSWYIVPDKDLLHPAIVIDMKDEITMASELKRDEASMPAWFSTLLYRSSQIAPPVKASFSGGSYGSISTRYVVLDPEKGISLDYAVVGKKLVIGTSKDSFRAVLDRVIQNGLK